MKRCDPPVVLRVLQFLEDTFPGDQGSNSDIDNPLWLDWTTKQFEALQLWKTNARRATGKNQEEPRGAQANSQRRNKEDFN